MPDEKQKNTVHQKELKDQLDQMVKAFDEFHATVIQLKKQQQDVVKHIHTQIDQKKIDQIHTILQSM